MKIVLLFALLYLCCAAQGFCCKKGSAAVNNTASLAGFSAFQYCICAALMLLVVRPTSLPSDPLLLGLSFAAGCSMYISSLCTFCVVHMGTPIYWTTILNSNNFQRFFILRDYPSNSSFGHCIIVLWNKSSSCAATY